VNPAAVTADDARLGINRRDEGEDEAAAAVIQAKGMTPG
jgi:hypothetical protein